MAFTINKETIKKYDVVGPRYTSYPTAPNWNTEINNTYYQTKLKELGQTDKTLSLYVHIPFCQTMCTYCACNVIIRRQDKKYGDEYLTYLFKEIDLIQQSLDKKMTIRQLHWGGGTPTFLNEDQIARLYNKITDTFAITDDAEIAIEIDPRTIDEHKVRKLHKLGFNRISMGVQDFDAIVQEKVNRIQPFPVVKKYYDLCRELNFDSVNFDLIYGLPGQNKTSFADAVDKVISLKPDRIALYSFAFVPWLKKHQNKIIQDDLPVQDTKLDIFLNAREQFLNRGYQTIAMDHFALENDELAKAFNNNKLYRNFMGYTVKPADEYIGIGLTSIGFLQKTFIQNHKTINDYYHMLDNNELPVERGKALNEDDVIRQWTINSLMCHFHLDKKQFKNEFGTAFEVYFTEELEHLVKCEQNGLIALTPDAINVLELGRIFIRNICMGFDHYLPKKGSQQKFSRTV